MKNSAHPYGWAATKIQQEDAWEIETGNPNLLVGILDSGIDANHPELSGKIHGDHSKNFVSDGKSALTDYVGHGTHVAGIIAAKYNNDYLNFCGVCQSVKLVSLRVADGGLKMRNEDFAAAVNYAQQKNIPLLNISLEFTNTVDSSVLRAIENYKGLMVWAAGNRSLDYDEAGGGPVYWDDTSIIVVGASTSTDTKYSGSNFGEETVDIFAPGAPILSSYPQSLCSSTNCSSAYHSRYGYHYMSGTSQATPFITGVAALIMSRHPSISPAEIKEVIIGSADEVAALVGHCASNGRLNAYSALSSPLLHADVDYDWSNYDKHWVRCQDCDYQWLEDHILHPALGSCLICN